MARCSVCGSPAVAHIRYQRRYLCERHLIEYVESKIRRSMSRYKMVRPGYRVLVPVSGGKDSATVLAVLSRLSRETGFEVIALHIDLGIGEYSVKSKEASMKAAGKLGVPLVIVSVKEITGYTIPELARKAKRPVCSVCGLVKRYLINLVAMEIDADAVALGHNADDLAVYSMKSFITQDLSNLPKLGPKTESIPGLAVGRIRPLYEVYEKESYLYALLTGTPFLHEECPNVDFNSMENRLKVHINSLEEEKPGVKITMLRNMAKRIKDYPKPKLPISKCKHCGLLSSGDECSFCRLTRRITGRPLGPKAREAVRSLTSSLQLAPRQDSAYKS
ncbi:MAG: TIGR00269 family protein [Desulfurococcales archaeon]|nr:TIGR00269 family protein [Desulfurococcales archaeon]MCE4605000.1 TIGR00269 family protein [Desulfurococcales archaeon]